MTPADILDWCGAALVVMATVTFGVGTARHVAREIRKWRTYRYLTRAARSRRNVN